MRQVIVVEGKNDKIAVLRAFPSINVITTNGYDLNEKLINTLKSISDQNEIVLLLDPDGPGERMRKFIADQVEGCKHAFIKKEDAINKTKRKVGVEHASVNTIKDALSSLYKNDDNRNLVARKDLYQLGLVGKSYSKKMRMKLLNHFQLGYVNSKQLPERLALKNISMEELTKWVNRYNKNDQG